MLLTGKILFPGLATLTVEELFGLILVFALALVTGSIILGLAAFLRRLVDLAFINYLDRRLLFFGNSSIVPIFLRNFSQIIRITDLAPFIDPFVISAEQTAGIASNTNANMIKRINPPPLDLSVLARGPLHVSSCQQMKMNMKHRLPGVGICICHYPEAAFIIAPLLCEL